MARNGLGRPHGDLTRPELLRDVFCRACERSAARYAAVRQSLAEPDPFRMWHRIALRELVHATGHEVAEHRRVLEPVTRTAVRDQQVLVLGVEIDDEVGVRRQRPGARRRGHRRPRGTAAELANNARVREAYFEG